LGGLPIYYGIFDRFGMAYFGWIPACFSKISIFPGKKETTDKIA
jgi:hypothetical protein